MTEFKSLDAADNLIAHYTGEPPESGRARKLAGRGLLKITFEFSGVIGQFPRTGEVPTVNTKAVKRIRFDGHLTAVASPRLNVKSEEYYTEESTGKFSSDWLFVSEVTLEQIDLQPESGYFFGRVVTIKDEEHARGLITKRLNTGMVPVSEWQISSDEIEAFCVQAKTGTTAPKPAAAPVVAASVEPTESGAPEKEVASTATVAGVALGDETPSPEKIRYEVLASRTELIEAFSVYGVELKIFRALKDRPGLLAAYRVKGKGQKGSHAEPMFCPFEVINWLVKTGVKEKPRLKNFMGWHILETKFPSVYAEKSMCDPRKT